MLISFRSPLGGAPLRLWGQTFKKGVGNIEIAKEAEQPRITQESLYCIKIGYLEDGTEALIRDSEAFKLYQLLHKHYGTQWT